MVILVASCCCLGFFLICSRAAELYILLRYFKSFHILLNAVMLFMVHQFLSSSNSFCILYYTTFGPVLSALQVKLSTSISFDLK